MSLIPLITPELVAQRDYVLGRQHCKQAGDATPTYSLTGRLYASRSGWLLLSVPNAVVRGLFDALDEPGIELPTRDTDDPKAVLNAHVSVMSASEVESLGGVDKISERGHSFRYQLGPIKTVAPKTWNGVSRVWYCTVISPELRELRRSYGLSPQPHDDWDFHITVAIRRRSVLLQNDLSKVGSTGDEFRSNITLRNTGGLYGDSAEGNSRSSRHGADTGVPQLAGDAGALLQSEARAVPGLWRSGDYRVSKLAAEFLSVLPGYGAATAGPPARSEQEPLGVFTTQLLLGDSAGTSPQQEKQSTADARRAYQDIGGVGRDHRLIVQHDFDTDRPRSLERAGGVVNAVRSSKEKYAMDHARGPDSEHNGLGQKARHVPTSDPVSTEHRPVGGPGTAGLAEKLATQTTTPPPAPPEEPGVMDIPQPLLAAAAADKTPEQILGPKPAQPPQPVPAPAKQAAHRSVLKFLQEAKLKSDAKDYAGKNKILQEVMRKDPTAWKIDTPGRMSGVTHLPTGFKFHMPVGMIVPGIKESRS